MLGPFEFARPLWLVGLAALVPVALLALASSTGQPLWQRMVTLATRSLLVIAVVLALAGLSTKAPVSSRSLTLVTDRSLSCGTEGVARRQEFHYAAEAHGVEPRTLSFANDILRDIGNWNEEVLQGSDPATALQFAATQVPKDADHVIVLITDGRETAGDLRRAVRGIRVPVHVVPLGIREPSPIVGRIGIASAAHREDFAIVSIFAMEAASGEIVLLQGEEILARYNVTAKEGMSEHAIPIVVRDAPQLLTSALNGFSIQGPVLPLRRLLIPAASRIPVLVVAANAAEAQPLVDSLRAAGAGPEVIAPAAMPATAEKLEAYRLVVLANVKPGELAAGQAAALATYVRERGGGLLVAGDERTFAAAAYQGSPLEALAPLAAQRKVEERERSLALVLVFDKSNSMAGNRINFAKEAAKRAVGLLGASDKFGVISFGTDVEWVADVQPCDDASKARVIAQIDKLAAGGLTNMYPALERAWLALEQTPADRRHLVLLTDGVLDSKPGDFLGLAREMSKSGVTVSTLSVNDQAEHPLLSDIARLAKGRYSRVLNPADVVGIIERETQRITEETRVGVKAQIYRRLPKLEIGDAPALSNYAPTSPKPTAELLLMAGRRDPLLAWQRVGEGVVTAFAASPSDPAWVTWSGRGAFWARLLKHTARPVVESSKLMVRRERNKVIVSVDAINAAGHFVHDAKATAKITDLGEEGHAVREVTLEEIAPGRYEGTYDAPAKFADLVEVDVTSASSFTYRAATGVTRDGPDEFLPGPPNLELLREVAAITGGKFDPKPEDLFGPSDRVVYERQEWWRLLLVAAIVLFAIDLGLKRLG